MTRNVGPLFAQAIVAAGSLGSLAPAVSEDQATWLVRAAFGALLALLLVFMKRLLRQLDKCGDVNERVIERLSIVEHQYDVLLYALGDSVPGGLQKYYGELRARRHVSSEDGEG